MDEPAKQANDPLLSEQNDDNDGVAEGGEPESKTSFTVGTDSETTSLMGADSEPSSRNEGLVNGAAPGAGGLTVSPRAGDAESVPRRRESERSSSSSSLRGPVLTEPSFTALADTCSTGEMRKSASEHDVGQNGTQLKMPEALTSNISLCRPGHHIVIEEVAPSASSIHEGKEKDWKMSINSFTKAKRGKEPGDKKFPKSVRRYYKTQDELIDAFEDLQLDVEDAMATAQEAERLARLSRILAQVSFVVNFVLLVGKAVAAALSGSLAVISSVIDSAVDLVSGGLMWWSNRAIRKRNIYHYPQGRTKLEPLAIVILSVVMALASVQMIRESIEQIIEYATEDSDGPDFGVIPIVICCVSVVAKLVLYLVCRRVKTPSVEALSQDHRNDVLSNTVALACGLIGDKLWKYADPIGAIAISIYIVVSWFKTGWEQTKMLTGHTARPDFLKKITWLALNHHPKVMLIDTVRAFHFGNNFLVEVDIVLPEEMNLRESHDIGESLQGKIEKLTEVERAFVHLDYECEHHPSSEHKQV